MRPGSAGVSPASFVRAGGTPALPGSWEEFSEGKISRIEPLNQWKTSNIQHPTSNAEGRKTSRSPWMVGVGCSMLDVPSGSWEGDDGGAGVRLRLSRAVF